LIEEIPACVVSGCVRIENMGVFGYHSWENDTALDVFQAIQDAYGLCHPETRTPFPGKITALQNLKSGDQLFGTDGGEAKVAYRLLSDGYVLHNTVLETASECLQLELGMLTITGDDGSGWHAGGAKRRRKAIEVEIAALRSAFINSFAHQP
jgi:hypothetical protein